MGATKRVVDLTDVTSDGGSGFRPKRKPEGDYQAKIVKADDHEPKDTSKPMGWVLTIQVEGDARSSYPYYLSPEKKQAWKIGKACRAAGIKGVDGKKINFDPNKLVGKSIGIYLEDDEYEGREKSTIGDLFPVGEVQGNADEAPTVDEDEEEVIEDDEVEDEPEEEEPTPKRRATTRARKAAPAPAPEPEDDEEDEEEPEPTPPPRKRRAAPKPAPVEEDDEDELEEEEPPPPPTKTVRRRRPAPPPVEDDDLDLDDLDE